MNPLFRPQALAKVSDPDQLDQALRIIRPQHLLGFGVVAAVMIAGLIWSVISTAPVKVGGPGVLLSPAGVASVTAPDGSGRKASPARQTTSVRNTSATARCWPPPPARLPRSGLMLMTRSLPARSSPACWSTIREKPPADRHRLSACRRGQEGQGRDVRPRLAVHGQV